MGIFCLQFALDTVGLKQATKDQPKVLFEASSWSRYCHSMFVSFHLMNWNIIACRSIATWAGERYGSWRDITIRWHRTATRIQLQFGYSLVPLHDLEFAQSCKTLAMCNCTNETSQSMLVVQRTRRSFQKLSANVLLPRRTRELAFPGKTFRWFIKWILINGN